MSMPEDALSADPLIFASLDRIRDAISDVVARGGSTAGMAPVVDLVASVLETEALLARSAGKSLIFEGKLSAADAVQRANDLRELLLR
ncbi:hypothetical protein BA022_09260 [Diaphorobacter nitroreducens]|uniref:hypothetical protein n=1 Tax=Diaphorobacter nitroreducens TaxID=164759 RepID=UPI000B59913E|nr:hypothetical protein [Diaphorobacter nitroreducens]ASI68710.1 hypothetical protein BA022_09260 [Diaphorobacter nitroreducens]